MADLMRLSNVDVVIQKEKLGSPTGCSDDCNMASLAGLGVMVASGGIDLTDMAQELDQDEFEGPHLLNDILLVLEKGDCSARSGQLVRYTVALDVPVARDPNQANSKLLSHLVQRFAAVCHGGQDRGNRT
ncbi:GL19998 [Drosophila persimilis]|uniref:GL19998 n=1 Tax=Drosophila persimilis TaxID=7234 RepID=B4HDD0_DROPE|nr:GL19998 [Drosophila persimilis]